MCEVVTYPNHWPQLSRENQRVRFHHLLATNLSVVVEASTSLVNPTWSPISTNTLTKGSSYFGDPQWTNHTCRYYRLRSP